MKRIIFWGLLIANSILLLLFFLPFSQGEQSDPFESSADAIGIIGGADGPTAIYLAGDLSWMGIVLVILEVALGACLIIRAIRGKKDRL